MSSQEGGGERRGGVYKQGRASVPRTSLFSSSACLSISPTPSAWPSPENGKPRPRRVTTLSASCWVRRGFGACAFYFFYITSFFVFFFANSRLLFPPSSALGIPDDVIEKGRDYKLITEVTQDGNNFSWTQTYPANTKVSNEFTIDKECDMETVGGKKFKVEERPLLTWLHHEFEALVLVM